LFRNHCLDLFVVLKDKRTLVLESPMGWEIRENVAPRAPPFLLHEDKGVRTSACGNSGPLVSLEGRVPLLPPLTVRTGTRWKEPCRADGSSRGAVWSRE
jgi:hypothetical protein